MEHIKWLWSIMDRKYHKWHIFALAISAASSLIRLINPTLTARLMDEVFVGGNMGPLVPLLLTMVGVRLLMEV